MPRPNERWLFSVATDIERVGVLERGRVPVRRAEQGDHLLARAQALAAQLQVLADDASVELDGAVVAQQLVDGRFQQAGFVTQPLQLDRHVRSRASMPLPMRLRVVSLRGHQDQQHGGQQLLSRESLSPSSSAVSRALTISSRGSRCRASTMVSK